MKYEETTITLYDEHDVETIITGEYHPGLKGNRDRWGAPEAPDDDPEVYIISAVDTEGEEIELTDNEEEIARTALWEAFNEGEGHTPKQHRSNNVPGVLQLPD